MPVLTQLRIGLRPFPIFHSISLKGFASVVRFSFFRGGAAEVKFARALRPLELLQHPSDVAGFAVRRHLGPARDAFNLRGPQRARPGQRECHERKKSNGQLGK